MAIAKETCVGLHAGTGRAHLRHAEGEIPQSLRDDRRVLVEDQDHDVDVCARLDSALERLAGPPPPGDAATRSRQHRRARRRHERLARSFQHPGPDRSRADVEFDPRLSDAAERYRDHAPRLHVDARLPTTSAYSGELLEE